MEPVLKSDFSYTRNQPKNVEHTEISSNMPKIKKGLVKLALNLFRHGGTRRSASKT